MTEHVKVLSLDPGITTGYIVVGFMALGAPQDYTHKDTLKEFFYDRGTIKGIKPEMYGKEVDSLVAMNNPDRILIERIPDKVSKNVAAVRDVIDAHASHRLTYYISPGEWKPVAGKVRLPFSPSTQHEKDAYRMARYYFFKEFDVPLT